MITIPIKIDISEPYKHPIKISQYDVGSPVLDITLLNNAQPINLTGALVILAAIKPDKTLIGNSCAVSETEPEKGKCTYAVTSQTSVVAGMLTCQFIITFAEDAEKRSLEFKLDVSPSINITGAAESTNEFTSLQTALIAVTAFGSRLTALESGRVIAPSANTDAKFPQWDGTNSKTLKDGYTLANLISAVKQSMYRVGDIIMSVSATNPSSEYGGTWVAWGSGRVPVGVDTSQTEFNTVEKTGGEKTHTLINTEIPQHNHSLPDGGTGNSPANPGAYFNAQYTNGTNGITASSTGTGNVGAGQAHNNLQPYITCYMWKRTA